MSRSRTASQRRRSGRHVVSGALTCAPCARAYPIDRGVPDFVRGADAVAEVSQTTEGFAGNWREYNRVILSNELLNRELFADWVWPLAPTYLADKVVVEAGCGMGRWLCVAAAQSPRALIGFDYSTIAWTAFKNTAHLENVHVLRADIFHPPIRAIVDVQYSIGVVHHTPDPARAFASLQSLLNPTGVGSAWVYGKENNGWITRFIDPLRTHVTSRMPEPALHAIAVAAAAQLKLTSELYALSGPLAKLPYRDYLLHLRDYPLDYMSHIVFDHLVPSLAHYVPREEVESWARGLPHLVTPRNGNSWRLLVGATEGAIAAAIEPLSLSDVAAHARAAGAS